MTVLDKVFEKFGKDLPSKCELRLIEGGYELLQEVAQEFGSWDRLVLVEYPAYLSTKEKAPKVVTKPKAATTTKVVQTSETK